MNNMVPSVVSAVKIVERLAALPGGATQASLAESLCISQSTCYRILQSLASHGWVSKGADGAWRLSNGLMPVAEGMRERMVSIDNARAVLGRLAQEHGVACKLSFRRGMEQVVAVRAQPQDELLASGVEGVRYPVTEGSSGAALLADASSAEAVALMKALPKTQTDAKFLRSALDDLRARGWCWRRRINGWPISALSAPVRAEGGAIVASLTFIVPDTRHDDRGLPPLLLETARKCLQ